MSRFMKKRVREIATFSKGDDIKIKKNDISFFPPLSYLPFLTLLWLFSFYRLE